MKGYSKLVTAAAFFALATSANATIVTVFDGIAAGSADFDSTVTTAGGTVVTDVWSSSFSGTSVDFGDYVVTRNNGGSVNSTSYGDMSGNVIDISPDGAFGAPNGTAASGITFTFDSPVNSFGFEVGDWATCCHNPVTELFISFDGGAPITVASSTSTADGLFPSQDNPANDVYEIFVAAFDDTGDFTQIQFWGNGSGEFLLVGGQVKYALLDRGSLPGGNGVPVPAPLALMALGLLGVAVRARRA